VLAFDDDNRHDLLSQIGVRDAERFGDARDHHQCAFDRGLRDVLAASDDDVLAPPGDPKVPAIVDAIGDTSPPKYPSICVRDRTRTSPSDNPGRGAIPSSTQGSGRPRASRTERASR
jgi:hypothetical protein